MTGIEFMLRAAAALGSRGEGHLKSVPRFRFTQRRGTWSERSVLGNARITGVVRHSQELLLSCKGTPRKALRVSWLSCKR